MYVCVYCNVLYCIGLDEERSSKYFAEMFRVQVLLELLRLHITRNDNALDSHTPSRHTRAAVDTHDEECVRHVAVKEHPDHRDIESHLSQSLPAIMKASKRLSSQDLDEANRLYQPYINQLMDLKATLKAQLQEIDDTRAFMCLGVSKDSSDAAIKKAYHSKAVRLHPDKPGGDKEKFQKLQDMYQDVLKRRREEAAAEEAAMRAMDTPASRAEMQLVRDLVQHMEECMGDIQRNAAECTHIAQLSVRWQKMVNAASMLPHPRALKKLHKMITTDMDMTFAPLSIPGGESSREKLATVHNSAATLLLGPIDSISRAMHQVVTSCMQLLKSGERYGSTAGTDMAFMKRIEHCAQCGMALQQEVPALYPVENQILMCIDRADRSFDIALEDEDISSVLVRMIRTVFSTRAVTLSSTAEYAVTAAISAADLLLAVKSLVKSTDEEMLSAARQRASLAEREQDYCPEDLASMAEMRAKEQSAQREAAQRKREEEVQAKEEGRENEYMMGQIQSLQMQLRLQYIEALQTLNAETRDMQRRIVAEVGGVVREAVSGCGRPPLRRKAPPPPPPSDTSPDTRSQRTQGPDVLQEVPLKDSLFSLLAEFMDSSCISLRNDLRELHVANTSATQGADNPRPHAASLEAVIETHLGWMSSLGGNAADCASGDGGDTERSDAAEVESSEEALHGTADPVGTSMHQDKEGAESQPPASAPSSGGGAARRSVKLALLPDYRAKILWLSVMVDAPGVLGIVQNELLHRLRRDCVTAVEGSHDSVLVEFLTDKFCESVLRCIEVAVEDMPQTKAP